MKVSKVRIFFHDFVQSTSRCHEIFSKDYLHGKSIIYNKLIYDFEIIPENTRISHEKAELSKFKICFYNFSQNTSI